MTGSSASRRRWAAALAAGIVHTGDVVAAELPGQAVPLEPALVAQASAPPQAPAAGGNPTAEPAPPLTPASGAPAAAPGSEAILWGAGLPIDEVAQAAGTIGYELMCAVAPRVAVAVREDQADQQDQD